MKRFITALFLFNFISLSVIAQNFQGIATYQSSRKMDGFHIKAEGMSPEMQEKIKVQLQKQFQKEYKLKFNLTESEWQVEESLDGGPVTASSGGMMIRMVGGGGVTYKNTAENLFLQEREVFSKPFLVNDELESREWKITQETKKIGDYTAYKALLMDIRESRSFSLSTAGNGDTEKGSSQSAIQVDTIAIEAWYTPEIPVSQGPDEFWGLPGLILELKNGDITFLCTSITLNPQDGVNIKKPTKGKQVTREELKEEIDSKTMEMQEKFKNDKGGNVHIKIGGN